MQIDWNQLIADGIASLRETYRDRIHNVAILLEEEPDDEVRRKENLTGDETLLGLYQGIPLTERGEGYGVGATLPDTITLYTAPILEEADSTDGDVARVVRETLWHEFGHYFGLDEDDVRRREDERDFPTP